MEGGRSKPRPHLVRGHEVRASSRRSHSVRSYRAPEEEVRSHYVRSHYAAGPKRTYKRKRPNDRKLHSNPWQDFLDKKTKQHPGVSRAELAKRYHGEYSGGARKMTTRRPSSRRPVSRRPASRGGARRPASRRPTSRRPASRRRSTSRGGMSGHDLY